MVAARRAHARHGSCLPALSPLRPGLARSAQLPLASLPLSCASPLLSLALSCDARTHRREPPHADAATATPEPSRRIPELRVDDLRLSTERSHSGRWQRLHRRRLQASAAGNPTVDSTPSRLPRARRRHFWIRCEPLHRLPLLSCSPLPSRSPARMSRSSAPPLPQHARSPCSVRCLRATGVLHGAPDAVM